MTWIDDLATNRKMSKPQAEAAAKDIVTSTLDLAGKASIPEAAQADWKTQLDECGWIDRQDPPSDRIIEADLHVPGKTDLQSDRLAAERWPVVLPWMVKEGRFFWSHGKEREALSTSIVGKFTGWRIEKGLPVVQIGWYTTADSHSELDDLTWKALQDYHAKTGNWGHVSIDWDPNDKMGNKPQIECSKDGCWKNHTAFGAKGASWVGDEPACPGADVVYASDAKGLDTEIIPKDDIPEPLSNTIPIKSTTPKHDEAFRNVAISVKSGNTTIEQSTQSCGFCKAFTSGAKSAGASDDIALNLLDTHLKTFLEPEQMTTPPVTAPVTPAPKTEAKADPPAPAEQKPATPAMDINALIEEISKMKGDIEELKAQMEMADEGTKSLADALGYDEEKDTEEKGDKTTDTGTPFATINGNVVPIRAAPGYKPGPAGDLRIRNPSGRGTHKIPKYIRRKKDSTNEAAADIKTAAKDATTIPTQGMEPSTSGTVPATQEKGLSIEELGKMSLTFEGRNKLANM